MAKIRNPQRVPTLGELQAINSNVVGYWRFDGGLTDDTSNNITLNTSSAYVEGFLEGGIRGARIGGITNDTPAAVRYISASGAGVAHLDITGNITIGCLFQGVRAFNPTAMSTEDLFIAEFPNGADANQEYNFGFRGADRLRWFHEAGASDLDYSPTSRLMSGPTYFVAAVRNSNNVQFYVNGALFGAASAGAAAATGGGDRFAVGRTDGNHNGNIAALAVFNTALTAQNIAAWWDLFATEVGESPVATRAPLVGTDISFLGPRYLTQSISGNTTYTLSNPVLGRVLNLDITVTGTPTINVTGADFIRKDTVTAGRMILKVECIDDLTPTYLATLSDTV